MRPLFLTTPETVKVSRFRLTVGNESWEARQIPYDSIVLQRTGGAITEEAILWLSIHNMPVYILKWDGTLQSALIHGNPPYGTLRLAQYRASTDDAKRRTISDEIVRTKIERSEALLTALGFNVTLGKIEAYAAQRYYRILGIPRKNFTNRRNNQSTTIAGACLNYSLGLLEGLSRRYVNGAGLDPSVSFLHRNYYKSTVRHQGLYFDMMEGWRWMADLTALRFLARKPRGFYRDDDYSVRLSPQTARDLVRTFGETAGFSLQGKALETCMRLEIEGFARYLIGRQSSPLTTLPRLKDLRQVLHIRAASRTS